MPLRLGISITSLRRVFGDAAVDDGFRILTQSGDSIVTQNNDLFIVIEDAPVSGTFVDSSDAIVTEAGEFMELNGQPGKFLGTNHDIADQLSGTEGAEDFLLTQDLNNLVSQDGKQIILQQDVESQGDRIVSQAGDEIITQDGDLILTQQIS